MFADIITAILEAPEKEQPSKEDIEGIIGVVIFLFLFLFTLSLTGLQCKPKCNAKAA